MGITRFSSFDTTDKMILSSSVLAILLFATPNADGQRCNRWNICYEQIQQQENSALQETFKEINRTLISLEHEKSEMNNTIQLLENMVYEQAKQMNEQAKQMNEQAKQISKLVETYSDSREMEQAT